MLIQALSLFGAALILAGFAALQYRWLTAESAAYLWANFAGGALLGIVAWVERQWGFLLLEVVWTAVAARGLWRLYRGGSGT